MLHFLRETLTVIVTIVVIIFVVVLTVRCFVGIVDFFRSYAEEQEEAQVSAPQPVVVTEADKEYNFVSECFKLTTGTFRQGLTQFYQGIQETKVAKNDFGNVIRLELSPTLFTSKEYFAKIVQSLEQDEYTDINEATERIRSLIIQAAEGMCEAADLLVEGYLLKERIGQTVQANTLSTFQEGKLLVLPVYQGQIEQGLAKTNGAVASMIDALWALKPMIERVKMKHYYYPWIAQEIGLLSPVSRDAYATYVAEGKKYFEARLFFEAMISLTHAWRIRTSAEVIDLLAAAAEGMGGVEYAANMRTRARELFRDERRGSDVDEAVADYLQYHDDVTRRMLENPQYTLDEAYKAARQDDVDVKIENDAQ